MKLPFLDVINGRGWAGLVLQIIFIVCSVVAAISFESPRIVIVITMLMGMSIVVLQVAGRFPRAETLRWRGAVAAYSGVLLWLDLVLATIQWDVEFGVAAIVMAVALAATTRRMADASQQTYWKVLVAVWVTFLALLWMGAGYVSNFSAIFWNGFLAVLGVLLLFPQWFRLSPLVRQMANTLALLLVGLPVASLIYQFQSEPEIRPATYRNYYSFEKAKGTPPPSPGHRIISRRPRNG
jgi:hypothetical protein